MKRIPVTAKGMQQLTAELERLEKVERPHVIQAIAEARAHGDLKENAEYHAAKEQQGFIEARIRDLKSKLSHAQVIDVSKMKNEGTVVFGATVKLYNLETEEEQVYQIVGEDEADLKLRKISVTSPIARALIGKSQGSEVDVQTPGGVNSFEIVEVLYI
ncbi:MAG TPA: transcription elongation factor GreA [Gammaproteobacteria bacterium]|nr:transcription elongation factor GreA [Gammaproteobacteria bacterium]